MLQVSSPFYLPCHLDPVQHIHFIIVSSILVLAKQVSVFPQLLPSCLNKTSLVSSPISGVHTVNDRIQKVNKHTCNRLCFQTFIQNENKGPKANWKICGNSNVVSFNSETPWLQEKNESLISMLWLKRKKYIEKSFGQIGVKYLLPKNDFNLFSHNNSLGKECFQEEKLTHKAPEIKTECLWKALPFGFFYQ